MKIPLYTIPAVCLLAALSVLPGHTQNRWSPDRTRAFWDSISTNNKAYRNFLRQNDQDFTIDTRRDFTDRYTAIRRKQTLDTAGVLRDAGLQQYLWAIAAGAKGKPETGIQVEISPWPGIIFYPDGGLSVTTGLLATLRNDAELQAAAAREFAHFTLEHRFRNYLPLARKMRRAGRWEDISSVIGLVALATGDSETASSLIDNGHETADMIRESAIEKPQFAGLGYPYTPEQQSEADTIARQLLRQKGMPSEPQSPAAGSDPAYDLRIAPALSLQAGFQYYTLRNPVRTLEYLARLEACGVMTLPDQIILTEIEISRDTTTDGAVRVLDHIRTLRRKYTGDPELNRLRSPEAVALIRCGQQKQALLTLYLYRTYCAEAARGNSYLAAEWEWAQAVIARLEGWKTQEELRAEQKALEKAERLSKKEQQKQLRTEESQKMKAARQVQRDKQKARMARQKAKNEARSERIGERAEKLGKLFTFPFSSIKKRKSNTSVPTAPAITPTATPASTQEQTAE